ncbi:TetR/AcrR family transcriptional regulator [Alsobacter soli]|uniref:TetR/AcrR family transcriptional regulator n=1 Tax=Alsobacter soli TaxID=2109933 RepID=UPI001304F847|nr:TetR/AcrR family transcriptional regulator [Alsobacter soli]
MTRPGHAVNAAGRRARAPRKSALERREEILLAAIDFFAEHGFSGSTHVLAAAIGVRQALLYRYYESKDALVEAVFGRVAGNRWTHDLPAILGDRSRPLADRLADVYRAYASQDDGPAIRLLMRAALDGLPLPSRRGGALTDQIFAPLLDQLRHEAGLPTTDARPMSPPERDMLMLLHGAVVFQGVREHIYRAPVPDRDAVIGLYVETFLAGARHMMRALHPRPSARGAEPPAPERDRPARQPGSALERLAARRAARAS